MSDWNPKIPLNVGTGVFCLLTGYVLSLPVAFVPTGYLLIEPPDFAKRLYVICLLPAFLLLPIWSFTVVRTYKPLPTVCLVTLGILWLWYMSRVLPALESFDVSY